jgi:hypothetical protein
MTAYVRNRPGKPDGGWYIVGDTCTDSQGATYTCVATGSPGEWADGTDSLGIASLRDTALPTASAAYLGKFMLIQGAAGANPDTVHVCIMTDNTAEAETYAWVQVTTV